MEFKKSYVWLTRITELLVIVCICSLRAFSPPSAKRTARASLLLLRSTKVPIKESPSTADGYRGGDDLRDGANNYIFATPTAVAAVETNPIDLRLDPDGSLRFGNQVFLEGLEPSQWTASRASNDLKKQSLFLHASLPDAGSEHERTLGSLGGAVTNMLACARQSRYWMGPKTMAGGSDGLEELPYDTQFLLLELENGSSEEGAPQQYGLVLPLLDKGFRASLRASTTGMQTKEDDHTTMIQVMCTACSGEAAAQKDNDMRAVFIAVGTDPFQLLREGFEHVAQATGTFETLSNKQLPPTVNQFGWCTWDAFYSSINEAGVVEGVTSLRDAGTPAKFVILDDGWQQVSPSKPAKDEEEISSPNETSDSINWWQKLLQKFYVRHVLAADPESVLFRMFRWFCHSVLKAQFWKFFDTYTDFNRQLSGFAPNSKFEELASLGGREKKTLKGMVSKLKEELGVGQVWCWHALHGYWRGVSEELGRKSGLDVKTVHPEASASMLRLEPNAAWDPVSLFGVGLLTNAADLEKFYEKLHQPLVDAGIDGVKVDIQSGVSATGMGTGGPKLTELYTQAMEDSVGKRFRASNGAANGINCMCHSTENLYRYKVTAVARASDDFFPDRPESHTVHLINVVYNSLFLGEICLPDWDMFHSKHPSAGLHAAARAIGGCPVYVSDAPGHHDAELLRKLVLPDGSVLRASLPGRPTRDCLFVDVGGDGKSAMKIWNQNLAGNSGVVGAFHVQGVNWNFQSHENEILDQSPAPLVATVKPHDVETLRDHSGPFAVWRHKLSKLEYRSRGDSVMRVALNHQDWEIFTVVPLQVARANLLWGPIGLVDMLNSGGAIMEADNQLDYSSSGAVIRARLTSRGPGHFVAFTNRRPLHVLVDGVKVDCSYDEEDSELSFQLPEEADAVVGHDILVEWSNTHMSNKKP